MTDFVPLIKALKIVARVLTLSSLPVIALGCAGAQPAPLDWPAFNIAEPSKAAGVKVADIAIDSAEVNPSEALTITAYVTNTGDTEETYHAELRINDALEAERAVLVLAGGTETLCFSVCKCIPGPYKVTLGDVTGYFLVVSQVSATPPTGPDTPGLKLTMAPDFTGVDVLAEKIVALNEFKGTAVLLNFVNYGCSARLNNVASAQMLVIRDLLHERHDFMPMSISCGCCSPVELREFAADNRLSWPWIIDVDDSIIGQYADYLAEYGFPTLVFVDRKQYITEVTGYCDFFTLDMKMK